MSKFFLRRFFCVCLCLIFNSVGKKSEKKILSLFTYSVRDKNKEQRIEWLKFRRNVRSLEPYQNISIFTVYLHIRDVRYYSVLEKIDYFGPRIGFLNRFFAFRSSWESILHRKDRNRNQTYDLYLLGDSQFWKWWLFF